MKGFLLGMVTGLILMCSSTGAFAEGNCRFYFDDSYGPIKDKYNSKLGEGILGQSVFTLIQNQNMDRAVNDIDNTQDQFKQMGTTLIKDQVCVVGSGKSAENVIIMGSGLIVIKGDISNSGKREVYFYTARTKVSLKFNTFSIDRNSLELAEVGVLLGDKNGLDHSVKKEKLTSICGGKDQSKFKEQNSAYSDHKIASYTAYLAAQEVVSPQVSFKSVFDMLGKYTITSPVCSHTKHQLFSSVRGLINVKPEFSRSGGKEVYFFETQLDVDPTKETLSHNGLTTINMSTLIK